jgi:formate dehydrogenase major subunit
MDLHASAGDMEELDPRAGNDSFGGHGGLLTRATPPDRDPTLQHPRCVYQLLKRHYARYTPEFVETTCGVPKDLFLSVAKTLVENSGRERTSAFCYAVGWTQHSVGVQYIRTAAIIQLLLGNMGRCEVTPPSRARPTSPPCTTPFRGTSRCRTPITTPASMGSSSESPIQPAAGDG